MQKFLILILAIFIAGRGVVFAFSDSKSIDSLVEKGVIEGYEDGNIKPDNEVNRAEFLKMSLELAKYAEAMYPRPTIDNKGIVPNLGDLSNCFPDVQSEWFAKYVCYAKQNGIIEGYSDGYFRPEKPVKFVEATKILSETFDLQTTDNELWYRGYLEYFTSRMYIPNTIVEPNQAITRAEAAIMMNRIFSDGPGSYYCPLSHFIFQDNGSLEVKSSSSC